MPCMEVTGIFREDRSLAWVFGWNGSSVSSKDKLDVSSAKSSGAPDRSRAGAASVIFRWGAALVMSRFGTAAVMFREETAPVMFRLGAVPVMLKLGAGLGRDQGTREGRGGSQAAPSGRRNQRNSQEEGQDILPVAQGSALCSRGGGPHRGRHPREGATLQHPPAGGGHRHRAVSGG